MLGYYRNPINHIFFNESLIVCSLYSFGLDSAWQKGVSLSELFERTCFLSNLIRREEVLQERITVKTRDVFDKLLMFMETQKILKSVDGQVQFKSSGEAASLLIGSIVWQYIDIYYTMLVFTLSLSKHRAISEAAFIKDVQWMAETLYL